MKCPKHIPFEVTILHGMTITEKILAKASNREKVTPGDIINAKIDLVYTMDLLGKVLFTHLEELGTRKVFDPNKVLVVFDHQAPAPDVRFAELHKWIRNAVTKYGGTLFDIGRQGIMHQVVIEEGFILPGTVAVGTDSHTPTGGAMGAVVSGVGATDAAVAMATGKLWLRVPESVRIEMTGKMPKGVMSRDAMFYLMGLKGWDGGRGEWVYKSLEFAGPTIKEMSVDSRLTTTNLVSDMGAKNGIIEPDDKIIAYLKERTTKDYDILKSDPDAEYSEILTLDVSKLEPQVACPHSPDNVKSISEVEGIKIDQAVIGSCTNARIEDLRIASEIMEDRKVHPMVRMIVSPASTRIFKRALREGMLSVLADAGALICHSTCGPCYGAQLGVLASGEVCITSTPRNMMGRMGSPEAKVYLANPATIAASAIMGEITDPRKFL